MTETTYQKITAEVFKETERMIHTHGPRLAGTHASIAACDDLYEQGKHYSDSIHKDNFYIYKGAFLGWIKLLVISYLLSIIFLLLHLPMVSLILTTLSVLILYFQFIRYLPIIDKFFPKMGAQNVYGMIEPSGEVKQQIILSGHHDSAPIFNFFIHQPSLYNLRVTGSIGFVLFSLIGSIILLIWPLPIIWYIITITLSLGILLVIQMWFFASKKAAPGAGDNLVSTQIAFQVAKYFFSKKNTEHGLKHTRLIFASFDAEEEGLRGARAFARTHKDFLLDTKTYVLNGECLYDENDLFFLTSDINHTVLLSESLAGDLTYVANHLDIPTKMKPIAVLTGGTDAGEFAKIGVEATTLFGMPWSNQARNTSYHTPSDTIEHVSPKAVYSAIKIFSTYIIEKDKNA